MKLAVQHATDEVSNPALSAWIRILKVHNLVVKRARARLAEDCTMAQFDVIAQLQRSPDGMTFIELSRKLLVTAGNITGIVDRMENAGLVQRIPNPADRRSMKLQLTAKGKSVASRIIPKHSDHIREMFSELSEKEIIQLKKLLDKLLYRLEK